MLSARKMRKRKLTLPSVRHVKKLSGREEVGHGSVNRQQSSGVQEEEEEEATNESTQGSNLPKLENEKDSVLLELMQHGFEKLLAKRGIEALGSHSTFEEVMVYLISLEEEKEYNAEYDRAALASEGEKEAIQLRRKQREQDLLHNCSLSLLNADEFRHSYLLGRHASLAEADRHSNILYKSATVADSYNCAKPSSSEAYCCCGEVWSRLREGIAELLLLESRALKWFDDRCHAYFNRVIDRLLESCQVVSTENISDNITISGNEENNANQDKTLSHFTLERAIGVHSADSFLAALSEEISNLKEGIYAMPEVAAAIPKIFLEAMGREFDAPLSLEADGIEEVKPLDVPLPE